jgi:hypothetical protein
MAGHELVESVDEPGHPQRAKGMTERAGRVELDEQQHAAASVPPDGRAVSEHEPPTFGASRRRDGREQPAGLLVGQRQ